jgi:hypothetical protein
MTEARLTARGAMGGEDNPVFAVGAMLIDIRADDRRP